MNAIDKRRTDGLQKIIGYDFKNPELLWEAFRHASYANEHVDTDFKDNERLEFLGDAVLDLAISHLLMERFQEAEEGRLSKYRALIVDETGLCHVAQSLGLGEYILLGKGEEQSCGREKPSILANTVEAVLGAIYLDAGFSKAMEIIRKWFSAPLKKLGTEEMEHDFKSLLQEYTQQKHKVLPQYRMTKETGPAHDKSFEVTVTIMGDIIAYGEGKSKKEAEQMAAKEACICLKIR